MLTVSVRTIIMYIIVVSILRLLGKRQLSDFEPSELVVTIMISEIAAFPVQDNSQPLFSSIAVIILLLVCEMVISFSAFKSPGIRKIVYGTPSVFFEKGKINIKEMEKQRFSVTDLMEAVRNEGIPSLSDVDFVIMETNGNISVIQSSEARPYTPKDAGLQLDDVHLSYIIIDDGKVYHNNLKKLGYDETWLKGQLKKEKINSIKEVFYFSADIKGNTFIMGKES